MPYDPRDLIPIARISKTVVAVSIPTSLNVSSLKELEALARAKPGQLNWTTATGFTDFVFAGYLHTLGLKMAKVPYKNPAGAVTDLAAGVIQVYMPAYAIVRPQVEAGTVKVLAVTNHERAPAIPNVPTAVEAGYPSRRLGKSSAPATPPNSPPRSRSSASRLPRLQNCLAISLCSRNCLRGNEWRLSESVP